MTEAPQTRVLVQRTLPATPAAVFGCFSDPARLSQWFYAGDATYCEAESDFRVGGRIRFLMYGPGDAVSEHGGRWVEIHPPHRLCMTWIHADDEVSMVQFDLEPHAAGTRVTVTHTRFPIEMLQLFEHGWGQCLGYLAKAVMEGGGT